MLTRALRVGPLQCTLLSPSERPAPTLVVLCHGYGANRHDLADVARAATGGAATDVDFLCPDAPLSLGHVGGREARAWWELDIAYLQRRQQSGPDGLRALQQETFVGLPAARRALRQCVEAAMQRGNLNLERVVLAGFSQGAMLVTDLSLSLEEPPAALCVLSGTLIDAVRWERLAAARTGLRVVQSHGRHDPVLPFSGAKALQRLLGAAGMSVQFIAFDGGHTVAPAAIDALHQEIARLAPPPGG